MSGLLSLLSRQDDALIRRDADELLRLNDLTRPYGLSLTHEDAVALLKVRTDALKNSRRIEVGPGVLEKLAEAFCDSAYVDGQNYADTLCALTELFYYLKNDTLDSLPDDELIAVMKQCFDGDCEGSLELLAGRDMETMARNVRAYGSVEAPLECGGRRTRACWTNARSPRCRRGCWGSSGRRSRRSRAARAAPFPQRLPTS